MIRNLLSFALLVAGHAFPADSLLFRASLERSATAEFAAGDREPLGAAGVRFDSAAVFPPNAKLTYDARRNLYAEQGTVSFHWRPDQRPGRLGFPLFLASYEQHSTWDFNFARIEWTGSQLAARIRDRNLEFQTARASVIPETGRWMHVALVWSEPGGLTLYLDGKSAAHANGPLALDARLDQFGFLSRAITPHHTSGTEDPGAIKDARVYRVPLGAQDVARLAAGGDPVEARAAELDWPGRFGWDSGAGILTASALTVKQVPVRRAKDLGKFWLKGSDGKRETVWPMSGHGYEDEGKVYRVWPEQQRVNLLRTTGDLRGRISIVDGPSFDRSGSGELRYFRLPASGPLKELSVERNSGILAELTCLFVEEKSRPSGGEWITFAQDSGEVGLRNRRDPARFTVWKPGHPGAASTQPQSGPRYHYLAVPAATEVPLGAVRLRIAARPGAYYYAAVQDPVNTSRELIEFDVRAAADRLDLTLDFPGVVVPAGRQVVITLASSDPEPPRAEAQLILTALADARGEHIANRIPHIRDSFQTLSEARPWMMIGRSITLPQLRRQLKLVDELYTLLEDVRRLEPAQPIVNGYWSWINRAERPPKFDEPPRPDPAVPWWAHRQLVLLRQFREVVDWWIDNRQVETGEMGGGLGDDTDMIQNWPALALLDGPAEKIKGSVRRVLEACYAQGLITNGMNTRRTDALHAYEEGMNAYGPAFLVDYGNPVLFERMLETASHYPRLTGINSAGHRHFRSYQYSATDVVEEGYHAREDIYSHLILHPGLYVAWYSGLSPVTRLLREFGDSLLAHWQKESYPRLAKGIFFADDRVEDRSGPNTETYNLFWGLFDITGEPGYLWLQRESVKAGDIWRGAAANGLWLHAAGGDVAAPLAAEVRKRNIDDHNLQTDQAGLVARVLAWQAGGDLKLVEEAHAALVQHMTQNMYLYTEAEQFTDRIWIPTLSVQRERLGGVAHYRNHIYPGHAVSWEETGGEVAALVPAARQDALRLIVFNAGTRERRATVRVWQLENGRYEVSLRDENGKQLSTRTLALKRYSPVALDLPSKRTVTVEFRQVAKGRPLSELPDLAISAEEVRGGDMLEVPVHNIGAAESRPFTVSVRDEDGRVLAESRQAALAAPLDLKAKIAKVRFPRIRPRPGLSVSVMQEGNSEEICEENNRIHWK
jgi:hypothetical protein